MISGRRVVAVVPARAGSKGVVDKNLRLLSGLPLIAWPILVAGKTASIDRIIVSTDGENIADVAREYGAEVYMRPNHLATDTAPVIDALRDLYDQLKAEGEAADIIVLLEATSPFRTPADIEACLERMVSEEFDSIATFSPAHLNPHRAWRIDSGVPTTVIEGAVPWLPRQSLPEAWQLTGTVYAFDPKEMPENTLSILFGRLGAHVVAESASIDIDTETDLVIANVLFESSELASID